MKIMSMKIATKQSEISSLMRSLPRKTFMHMLTNVKMISPDKAIDGEPIKLRNGAIKTAERTPVSGLL